MAARPHVVQVLVRNIPSLSRLVELSQYVDHIVLLEIRKVGMPGVFENDRDVFPDNVTYFSYSLVDPDKPLTKVKSEYLTLMGNLGIMIVSSKDNRSQHPCSFDSFDFLEIDSYITLIKTVEQFQEMLDQYSKPQLKTRGRWSF